LRRIEIPLAGRPTVLHHGRAGAGSRPFVATDSSRRLLGVMSVQLGGLRTDAIQHKADHPARWLAGWLWMGGCWVVDENVHINRFHSIIIVTITSSQGVVARTHVTLPDKIIYNLQEHFMAVASQRKFLLFVFSFCLRHTTRRRALQVSIGLRLQNVTPRIFTTDTD